MVLLRVLKGPRTAARRGPPARDAGREGGHVAAAVVDRALLREPAAAPDQEGANRVDDRHPERDEEHPRLEVHAAEERATKDDDGDRAEDELEVHHRGGWESNRGQAATGG